MVLDCFSKVSGLQVNPAKSNLCFLHAATDAQLQVASMLGCHISTFPLTYLGLPLSNKKPKVSDFNPLIVRFQKKLNGWTSRMLSQAGRVVLINSCLSTLPVYFMTVFHIPVKVVKAMDKIRRDFFWHGNSLQGKQIHMVAWHDICRPKSVGGLGIKNLAIFNLSLLAKWLLKWSSPGSPLLKSLLRATQSNELTPFPINSHLSGVFQTIWPILQINLTFHPSEASHILFWHHNWGQGILMYTFPLLFRLTTDNLCSLQTILLLHQAGQLQSLFQFHIHSNYQFQTQLSALSDLLNQSLTNWGPIQNANLINCHLYKPNSSLASGV